MSDGKNDNEPQHVKLCFCCSRKKYIGESKKRNVFSLCVLTYAGLVGNVEDFNPYPGLGPLRKDETTVQYAK